MYKQVTLLPSNSSRFSTHEELQKTSLSFNKHTRPHSKRYFQESNSDSDKPFTGPFPRLYVCSLFIMRRTKTARRPIHLCVGQGRTACELEQSNSGFDRDATIVVPHVGKGRKKRSECVVVFGHYTLRSSAPLAINRECSRYVITLRMMNQNKCSWIVNFERIKRRFSNFYTDFKTISLSSCQNNCFLYLSLCKTK